MEMIRTFSINLPIPLYQKLLSKVGKGKISKFIKEVVEEKLEEGDNKLTQEYKEAYQNSHLKELAKKWEKAEIKSWLNYEKSKNR